MGNQELPMCLTSSLLLLGCRIFLVLVVFLLKLRANPILVCVMFILSLWPQAEGYLRAIVPWLVVLIVLSYYVHNNAYSYFY